MSLLGFLFPERRRLREAVAQNTAATRRLARAAFHSIIQDEDVRQTFKAANEAAAAVSEHRQQRKNGAG